MDYFGMDILGGFKCLIEKLKHDDHQIITSH